MSLPSFIRTHEDGVLLSLKVQPRAAKNEIAGPLGDELRIKVTAPPVEAAANEALVRFLAETLDCPRGSVQLVRGHTSRHKQVFIRGLGADTVLERIAQAGG